MVALPSPGIAALEFSESMIREIVLICGGFGGGPKKSMNVPVMKRTYFRDGNSFSLSIAATLNSTA